MALALEEAQQVFTQKLEKEVKTHSDEQAKKAKYKIQVWFKSDRHLYGLVVYTLSFWESGKRLHGGGDEMMFICQRHASAAAVSPFDVARPSDKVTNRGCGLLIPGELVQSNGLVICPHCQTRHLSTQIGDSVLYKTTMTRASEILATWWRKLESNADVYVKYSPTDPRTALMSRSYSPRKARELKGLTIYPLERIIKDTLGGATVESRFRALITS